MPPAQSILQGLARVANGAVWVSIAWHGLILALCAALLAGFRPRKRTAVAALSAPLASVALLGLGYDNPFNGAVFSLLAVAVAILARRAPQGTVALRRDWSGVLGAGLVVFGLAYPHFLEGASWLTYLYAAPVGTIPCPTLCVVIGAALMADGFDVPALRLLVIAAGGFYAVFGVLRLGVAIDVFLLCGVVGLLVQSLTRGDSRENPVTVSAR